MCKPILVFSLSQAEQQINKVKHECVIEIGKRDGRRDLLKNTNLSGQDNIDSSVNI